MFWFAYDWCDSDVSDHRNRGTHYIAYCQNFTRSEPWWGRRKRGRLFERNSAQGAAWILFKFLIHHNFSWAAFWRWRPLVLLQQFFLTSTQLQSWGWRIPFLIGALIAFIGIFLRRNMEETESFAKHAKTPRKVGAIREAMRHKKACVMVFGLTLGGSVANYTFAAYMQKFLVNSAGMDRSTASLISVLSLIGFTVIQPVFGALSDRIGRRPLLLTFGMVGTFGTVPFFTFLAGIKNPFMVFTLVMTALAIVAMYSSVSTIT